MLKHDSVRSHGALGIIAALSLLTSLSARGAETEPRFMASFARAMAWSPDGSILAALRTNDLRIYDARTLKLLKTVEPKPPAGFHISFPAAAVKFLGDGTVAATTGLGEAVILWQVATWTELRRLEATGGVTAVSGLPDGSELVTAGPGAPVQIWDVATGKEVAQLLPAPSNVLAVAISPNGALLAMGDAHRVVHLWDLKERHEISKVDDYTGPILAVAFSPDSRLVASTASGKEFRIWDVTNGTQQQQQLLDPRHPTPEQQNTKTAGDVATTLAFVAGALHGVFLTPPGMAPRPGVGGYPKFNCSVEFSPDGKELAITRYAAELSADFVAEVYDVGSGQKVSRKNSGLTFASFSPDGKRLATSGILSLIVVDPETGQELK